MALTAVEARRPEEYDGAFAAAARERAGALLVELEPVAQLHRSRIATLAVEHRLPTMFPFREGVEAGGLMSYGASLADLFRRTTLYVDKILRGAKPGELPVEQATKFELVVNLKTAKALGLTIPPTVLARADETMQ